MTALGAERDRRDVSSLIAVALGVAGVVRARCDAVPRQVRGLGPGVLAARDPVPGVRDLAARAVHAARQGPDPTARHLLGLGLHAVVIGHVVVALPYTILRSCRCSSGSACRSRGREGPRGEPRGTFRRVTLPLLMPALVSAFLSRSRCRSTSTRSPRSWPVRSRRGPSTCSRSCGCRASCPSCRGVLGGVRRVVVLVLAAEIGRRLAERRYGRESRRSPGLTALSEGAARLGSCRSPRRSASSGDRLPRPQRQGGAPREPARPARRGEPLFPGIVGLRGLGGARRSSAASSPATT